MTANTHGGTRVSRRNLIASGAALATLAALPTAAAAQAGKAAASAPRHPARRTASSLTTREVLAAYIAAHGTDVPATLDTWGFAPMPGTTVVFDSAPHAVAHMGDFPALRLEPLESQPSGFQRFRMHL